MSKLIRIGTVVFGSIGIVYGMLLKLYPGVGGLLGEPFSWWNVAGVAVGSTLVSGSILIIMGSPSWRPGRKNARGTWLISGAGLYLAALVHEVLYWSFMRPLGW